MSIDTKQQILNAAEKLFAEHGIEAVVPRPIANNSGWVSVGVDHDTSAIDPVAAMDLEG